MRKAPSHEKRPTFREQQVLRLMAQGLSSVQIAATLKIAFYTVKTHRKNMMRRVGVNNTAMLVRMAMAKRWL